MKAYVRYLGTSTRLDTRHDSDAVAVEYRARLFVVPTGNGRIDCDQIEASMNATMERAFREWCANNGVEVEDARHVAVPFGVTA